MMMKRAAATILLAGALLAAGRAGAWLETGTLLTNSASATFRYSSGAGGSVTYSVTMKVLMANPSLYLSKECTPTYVGSAGGLVTYTVCFSNGGAGTAWNVTINDRLPNGSGVWWQGYGPGVCGNCFPKQEFGFWVGGGSGKWASYSFDSVIWNDGTPPVGQQGPLFLRWRVQSLGIGCSGAVAFVVSVG